MELCFICREEKPRETVTFCNGPPQCHMACCEDCAKNYRDTQSASLLKCICGGAFEKTRILRRSSFAPKSILYSLLRVYLRMYRLTRIQIVVVGLSLLIAATLSMSNNTVLHAISHYIYINTILAIIAISISLLLKKYQTNLYGEQQYHSYIERLVEGLGGPDPTSATSMPILMDFYQHELRQVINNRPNDQ